MVLGYVHMRVRCGVAFLSLCYCTVQLMVLELMAVGYRWLVHSNCCQAPAVWARPTAGGVFLKENTVICVLCVPNFLDPGAPPQSPPGGAMAAPPGPPGRFPQVTDNKFRPLFRALLTHLHVHTQLHRSPLRAAYSLHVAYCMLHVAILHA
jgi:hypothetical protein